MSNLTELKTLAITIFGLLASLFSPIQDFMVAMMILLTVNLLFGIASAVASGEGWSWKKACMFFVFYGGLFSALPACLRWGTSSIRMLRPSCV